MRESRVLGIVIEKAVGARTFFLNLLAGFRGVQREPFDQQIGQKQTGWVDLSDQSHGVGWAGWRSVARVVEAGIPRETG